jgi:drug/metabolite transporter (DMT)-like permease
MQNRPLAAAGAILTGMVIISVIDQFLRVIAEGSSLWTFHLIRSAMMWAMALAFVMWRGVPLRVVSWRGLVFRSVFLSIAMMIYFGALAFMPVAQAAAGLFTSPIWVLIFSVVLFGLRIGAWRIFAVLLGFAGILAVLSPDPATVGLVTFAPVLAGAIYGIAMISTREWCPEEGTLEMTLAGFTAMWLWALGGVIVVAFLAPDAPAGPDGFLLRGWVMPTAEVWFWLVVQAAGSLVAVVFLTRAYQLAEASYVGVFEYSLLGFSALFGWLVWGEVLGWTGLAGIAAIAAGGAIIAWRGREAAAVPT